jgi:DNA ligase-4
MYPLMRLVLPSIDTERGKYGLKQTAVSSIYVDALQLDKHRSKDAQALINWKVHDRSRNLPELLTAK